MMQKLLFISLLLLLGFSCKNDHSQNMSEGRKSKLWGTWINQDFILTLKDTLNKERSTLKHGYMFEELDTLSLQKGIIRFSNSSGSIISDAQYSIKYLSDSFLVLKATSKNPEYFTGTDSFIRFKRLDFIMDKSIKFEKIIFHSYPSLWNSSEWHIEIDSNKTVHYHSLIQKGRNHSKFDPELSGFFKGKLKDSSFQKLLKILQTSEIRTVRLNNRMMTDGVRISLIIYFNGQKKTLSSNALPGILNDLIDFFYKIRQNADLKRTKDDFKIEEL